MSRPEVDGLNTGYAALLLEQYLDNPAAVPAEWRELFEDATRGAPRDPAGPGEAARQAGAAERNGQELRVAPPAEPAAARSRGGSRAARRRRRGDGARQGLPHARPPRRPPRPARLRAARRPGARAGAADPDAHARAAGAHSRRDAAPVRRGRDARRRAAAAPRDVLRHDRLRDRAHLRPRGARLAAAGDRVRPLPAAASRRGARPPARPPQRGRGDGALPAPRLPRPEAVLDRGPRRDGADARRGDRARRRRRRARGRDRDGASRPPQRARPRRRPPVRGDPARVRGGADDRGRRRRATRAAPAT